MLNKYGVENISKKILAVARPIPQPLDKRVLLPRHLERKLGQASRAGADDLGVESDARNREAQSALESGGGRKELLEGGRLGYGTEENPAQGLPRLNDPMTECRLDHDALIITGTLLQPP